MKMLQQEQWGQNHSNSASWSLWVRPFTSLEIYIPSGKRLQFAIENGPVEIVDFPSYKMVIFHSFLYVYHRVYIYMYMYMYIYIYIHTYIRRFIPRHSMGKSAARFKTRDLLGRKSPRVWLMNFDLVALVVGRLLWWSIAWGVSIATIRSNQNILQLDRCHGWCGTDMPCLRTP